jgi:hypothetical protein
MMGLEGGLMMTSHPAEIARIDHTRTVPSIWKCHSHYENFPRVVPSALVSLHHGLRNINKYGC